jgi:hypothetical protein
VADATRIYVEPQRAHAPATVPVKTLTAVEQREEDERRISEAYLEMEELRLEELEDRDA